MIADRTRRLAAVLRAAREAVATFKTMPPAVQDASLAAQRESWARGEMELARQERETTRLMRPAPPPTGDIAERCERYRVALCRIARGSDDRYAREVANEALHTADRAEGGRHV